jgi:glycosyltransferase involved in cell wall biosynthesis
MEITAIIPNYNHARFLHRRLESVYGQTYPHLRVILLDDASSDSSKEIIETYRHHPRTQAIVYNETNCNSPFLQWKKGIDLVQTDWVWIAESDDWCEPDFLERLSIAFSVTDCVMAYAQLYWANEAGDILKPASPPEIPAWYEGKTFVREHIFGWNRLQNAGMLVFRRQAAQQSSPDWQGLQQAGDFRLWAEVASKGRVYGCGQTLCYLTKHPQSLTANNYHTYATQQELIDTWLWMQRAGCVSGRDIRQKIEKELVNLLCIRKAIPAGFFSGQWQFWTGQLERTGNPRRRWMWEYLALKEKWRHYRNKSKSVALTMFASFF